MGAPLVDLRQLLAEYLVVIGPDDERRVREGLQKRVERAMHAAGIYLSVGIKGVGNLFGFIPSDAPSFDAELAAAGRERGWRRS